MEFGLIGLHGQAVVLAVEEAAPVHDTVCATIQLQCVEVSAVMGYLRKARIVVMSAAQVMYKLL